ncbi:MAG: glycosyltransferase family 2 protein [Anaerolineae bacterium]|nr:glycosyltransferase family 2 protein [Anaerolineae bacterium]
MTETPYFSIIIPVKNAEETLERCLDSIKRSRFTDWELIVIDDGSSDKSFEIGSKHTNKCIRISDSRGPASARNFGANQAQGEYLFFTDADCVLHDDTLFLIEKFLKQNPEYIALIGSYDSEPDAKNFVSQYKNLFHHYTHQTSTEVATTFWAGCGAIQREAFLEVGGFDEELYPRPSIEDIELGYRILSAGGKIYLAKNVQVKHLKTWTILSLWKTDVFSRGIPWSKLLFKSNTIPTDLNLQTYNRWSVVIAWIFLFSLGSFLFKSTFGLISIPAAAILLYLNLPLYQFFIKKRGAFFLSKAVLLHWIFYFYNGLALIIGMWLGFIDMLIEKD